MKSDVGPIAIAVAIVVVVLVVGFFAWRSVSGPGSMSTSTIQTHMSNSAKALHK